MPWSMTCEVFHLLFLCWFLVIKALSVSMTTSDFSSAKDNQQSPRKVAPTPSGEQSSGEELANAVTHGIGLLVSIAGLVLLVVFSALRGDVWHVVSCSIYGSTLVLLYNFSMLYHAMGQGRTKRVFQILDHSAIFMLIAGTYTPFVLVTLRGGWGWALFGVVWGLCVVGIVCEVALSEKFRLIVVPIYLGMGWLVVIALRPLLQALPRDGFLWLAGGGVAYTVGVTFYVLERIPYAHSIWHVFVLCGSICHWISVMFFVIPRS